MLPWLGVALLGAVVCTICDHLHVIYDVLYYPKPVFWQQAWWVPLLFGTASVVFVAGAEPIRRVLAGRVLPRPTPAQLTGDAIGLVAAYSLTAFAHTLPDAVLGINLAFWLARVLRGTPVWLVIYCVIVAIGGVAFEGFWSWLGFFYYKNPDFLGTPRWLFTIYLHVSFLTAGLSRALQKGD
jgi:hypothetical protein